MNRRESGFDRSPTTSPARISPTTSERRRGMPVGKAKAGKRGDEEYSFVAPCFTGIDEAKIHDHLERDHFFWLDLTSPDQHDLQRLHELFGFHPLALEDVEHFGQRPKLDNYG